MHKYKKEEQMSKHVHRDVCDGMHSGGMLYFHQHNVTKFEKCNKILYHTRNLTLLAVKSFQAKAMFDLKYEQGRHQSVGP